MQLTYNNKFKPQRQNSWYVNFQRNYKRISAITVGFVITILLILKITTGSTGSTRSFFSFGKQQQNYIKHHGFYKNDILTKSVLIFPSIEHAPFLRELTVDSLFNYQIDPKGTKSYSFPDVVNEEDHRLNSKMNDETNQMIKVKNSFLTHGKLKFDGPRSPEVVIVTGIDFESNELSSLTKIVQNRVNYAQNQKYGIYVRWFQEFLPILQADNQKDYKKIAKLYILRNAMYAFPNAKYFWYLDENSLIMKYDVDLFKYLLNDDVLDPILLRDQPLIPPNGIIHTYKNQKASNVEFIITQLDQDLNADSFIIKNSFFGKSLVEFWADPLFRKYHNFPKAIESSLLHILQWHPVYLSRTGLVPSRTIASLYSALESSGEDDTHYADGDFVVNFRDCDVRGTCNKEIDLYWSILEKKK